MRHVPSYERLPELGHFGNAVLAAPDTQNQLFHIFKAEVWTQAHIATSCLKYSIVNHDLRSLFKKNKEMFLSSRMF